MLHHYRNIIWYTMKQGDIHDVWTPSMFFSNALDVKKIPQDRKLSALWFHMPHGLFYVQILVQTISCNLNFQSFPFDSHECILNLRTWSESVYRVRLNSPKIYDAQKNVDPFDYHFSFESLQSTEAQWAQITKKHTLSQIRAAIFGI